MYYLPSMHRLQMLYALIKLAPNFRWHDKNQKETNVLCNPLNREALKQFDLNFLEYVANSCNVRLRLRL